MKILTINDKNIQLIGRDCWTGYEYEPNTSYLQGIDSRFKKKRYELSKWMRKDMPGRHQLQQWWTEKKWWTESIIIKYKILKNSK